ncbi:MAG: SbcC/MukB-like Walker B domain-containing protein, partial [Candidatus Parabeggiatoa sp.]|nr:SbcC/MukB-like Walker B domain-containing protein [Candidatus Parabeggiatoa sp.]
NWGNLPQRTSEFGSLTLLTGGSGAGKTTMGDAIQTVMTAAKQGLYAYNPGQEETTQHKRRGKTPRTLPSYILGADDQDYARPEGAHGYVALIFSPSPDEQPGNEFSAVVGITAYLQTDELAGGRKKRTPRTESVHLITLEGKAISIDDFILERDAYSPQIVPPDDILNRLRRCYGETVIINDFNDNKKNYLNKLYGLLRGLKAGVNTQESEQAARAFSKFMAYKPIDDINHFVREEILEPQDIKGALDRISNLLAYFDELRKEAERLEKNIAWLEKAQTSGEQVRSAWFTRFEQRLLLAFKQNLDEQSRLTGAQKSLMDLQKEETDIQRRLSEIEQHAEGLDEERLSIERQRQQHQTAQEKDHLQRLIEEKTGEAINTFTSLRYGVQIAQKNSEYAHQLSQTKTDLKENETLRAAFKATIQASAGVQGFDMDTIHQLCTEFLRKTQTEPPLVSLCQSLAEELNGIEVAHARFQQAVAGDENGLRDIVSRYMGQRLNEISELENQTRELNIEIEELRERGEVRYPKVVQRALTAIRQQYPEANPQVLCDLVEVPDEQWQAAIEGYLGANRYCILVETLYEKEAIDTVRQMTQASAKKGAQVIQGEKALRDAERIGLPPESIIPELKVKHPTAQAYLQASYGNVIQVPNLEILRLTARGLTQEGHGSSSYKMFMCALGDHELVFGAEARKRALTALEKQYAEKEAQLKNLQREKGALDHVSQLARDVERVRIETEVHDLVLAAKAIAHAKEQIARLDLSDIKELDKQLDRIQAELKKRQKERDTNNKRMGKIDNEKASKQNLIQQAQQALNNLKTEIAQRKDEVLKLQKLVAEYDAKAVIDELAKQATSPLMPEATINEQLGKAKRDMQVAKDKFKNVISEYNQKAKPVERVTLNIDGLADISDTGDDFYTVMETYHQVKKQLKTQKEIGLADQKRQLSEVNQSVQKAFTSDFCNTVISALETGKARLDILNRELKGHRFGEEQYYFDWNWVPEYQRYYKFFQAVMQMDAIKGEENLFSNNTLSEQDIAVRDEITQLLLHEQEELEKSRRRLEEISDYRNYRRYEIYKDTGQSNPVPLSEYGTGSGGQLETPAYVIRAAAVSSAFRLNEGNRHLRMVLIDESFSKMDEQRAKAILTYLSNALKFQIIFIIPTKSAGPFQPLLTNQFVFSKIRSANAPGEMSSIVQVQEQILNQEAVNRLWNARREQVKQQVILDFAKTDNKE